MPVSSNIWELTYRCQGRGGEVGRGEEDKARTAEGGACRDQAHLGPCRSRRGGLRGWEGRALGVGGRGHVSSVAQIQAEFLQACTREGGEASISQKSFHSGNVSSLRFPPGPSSVFSAQTANFSC